MLEQNHKEGWTRREALLLPLVPAIAVAVAMGCRPGKDYTQKVQEILEQKGMNGDHPLVSLSSIRGWQVGMGGGFLAFSGSGGDISKVQFAWTNTVTRFTVISEVPYNKALFSLIENQKVPLVEFVFNLRGIPYNPGSFSDEPLDSANPNDYLTSYTLRVASFRLSPEDFERLPPTATK